MPVAAGTDLELVGHERRRDDVALLRPAGAVGHEQAAADEVPGALPLQPRLAGGVRRVLGRQELLDHRRVRQAQPRLAPIPVQEQVPCKRTLASTKNFKQCGRRSGLWSISTSSHRMSATRERSVA
jgi:hypothetical protein